MKKILFIIPDFAHGGTNKSLESYLALLDKTNYDVSIFCHTSARREGYYFSRFSPYLLKNFCFNTLIKVNSITRKMYRLAVSIFPGLSHFCDVHEANIIQKNNKFDVIIGFQEGPTTKYASLFEAKIKIAWLHSFFSLLSKKEAEVENKNVYDKFTRIVCVSNEVKAYFQRCLPGFESKCVKIYNPLNSLDIQSKAKESIDDEKFDYDGFKILSVGRLDDVKNFHVIPEIIKNMKSHGASGFKWFIMGASFNEDYKRLLLNKIEEYQVAEELVLLGQKDNPYPYINKANLMVCPSKSEGYPYVLNEAKILHTPIVANSFKAAYEVVNEDCGFIVDIDKMAGMLLNVVQNREHIYDNVLNSITKYSYNNDEIFHQLQTLLD